MVKTYEKSKKYNSNVNLLGLGDIGGRGLFFVFVDSDTTARDAKSMSPSSAPSTVV